MVKRVYIIAGVIFILVFMVWGLGRICYNVDLDSLLKKTENSLLDTSQEKNQYLNYQIINGNLYLQKEDGLYQYNYENGEEEKILENSMEDFMIIGDKIYYTKVNNNAIELYNCLSLFCENIGKDNSKKLVGDIENCIFNKSFALFCRKKENELKVYRYDIATKNCKIIVSLSQNIINKEMMFVIQDNIIFGENDRSKIYSYNMRTKEWGGIFSIPLDGQDLFFYVTGVQVMNHYLYVQGEVCDSTKSDIAGPHVVTDNKSNGIWKIDIETKQRQHISKNICAGGIYVLNNKLFGINNGKYVNLS